MLSVDPSEILYEDAFQDGMLQQLFQDDHQWLYNLHQDIHPGVKIMGDQVSAMELTPGGLQSEEQKEQDKVDYLEQQNTQQSTECGSTQNSGDAKGMEYFRAVNQQPMEFTQLFGIKESQTGAYGNEEVLKALPNTIPKIIDQLINPQFDTNCNQNNQQDLHNYHFIEENQFQIRFQGIQYQLQAPLIPYNQPSNLEPQPYYDDEDTSPTLISPETEHTNQQLKLKYPQLAIANHSLLRLNEDQVLSHLKNGLESSNDLLDHHYHNVMDSAPVDIACGSKQTFFDTDFTDEMEFNRSATKEYTNLKYFKVKHSNLKRLQEMKANPGAVKMEKSYGQLIKRDLVEYCFDRDLEIFRITKKFKRCLKWMLAKGIIPDGRACPSCASPMRLVNIAAKAKDGVMYKCHRHDLPELRLSIREGTIFEGSHLTLMESLRVIFYYFSRGFNALQAYRDLKEYNLQSLQYGYVADMYRRARHLIHLQAQNAYRRHKLGGFGRVVEIDESVFGQTTKDGQKQKVWVIGFYERGSKDVRAFTLRDKSEATILALVRENVMDGAEIVTDSWKGYNSCKYYYNHRISNRGNALTADVSDKPNLPNQGGTGDAYISRVQSLWHMLKRNIHVYSTVRQSTLQKFLDEACWRIRNKTFSERNEFLMQLLNVTK